MRYVSSSYIALIFSLCLLIGAGHVATADPPAGMPEGNWPAFWQLSTWALPSSASANQLIADVDGMASQYDRIAIVGSGTFADALTAELEKRIGKSRVVRTSAMSLAAQLVAFRTKQKADLLIRVTDTPPKPLVTGEQSFIAMDTLHQIADTIHSGLSAVQSAEEMLNDSRSVSTPQFRRRVTKLQGLLGDWTTPEARGFLDRGDKLLKATDWILAGAKDLHAVSNSEAAEHPWKFLLVKSELFDHAVNWLVDDGSKQWINWMAAGGTSKLGAVGNRFLGGGVASLTELAAGIRQQIQAGHYTIDALEHYMDASVAATSMAAAMVLTDGNFKVAKNVSDFAVSLAKTGRSLTALPIKALYDRIDTRRPEQAFELWQTQTILDARRGKPPVDFADWAKANGFDAASLSPEFGTVARDTYTAALRMAQLTAAQNRAAASSAAASMAAGRAKPPSSQQRRGGVLMSPNPRGVGKAGAAIRASVLRSRPPDGGLTWKVKLPDTGH